MERSPLVQPSGEYPVYTRKTNTTIKVFPSTPPTTYSTSNVTCNYVARPTDILWGYETVGGSALYNSGVSVQPQLHESEETLLVLKVLALAGISIEDPQLYQIASQEEVKQVQQEKQ